MSIELEDIVYPSSRLFAQDQRAGAHHNSNRSTDSLEDKDSESVQVNSPLPQKKLCQHGFNKFKRWFHKYL